jgi:hypothetical protein
VVYILAVIGFIWLLTFISGVVTVALGHLLLVVSRIGVFCGLIWLLSAARTSVLDAMLRAKEASRSDLQLRSAAAHSDS